MIGRLLAAAACLTLSAYGQGPGNGISKNTRACSEGLVDTVYAFMTKYFPVVEADDDCRNRQCTCGKQARVALRPYGNGTESAAWAPEVSPGFGLHCVYAAGRDKVRAKESGPSSVEDIEAIFQQRLGGLSNGYDAFMDYSTVLHTADLDSFVSALKRGNEPYLPIESTTEDGATTSSVIVSPGGQVVIEVVGKGSSELLAAHPRLIRTSEPRGWLGEELPEAAAGRMTPLIVSHASANLTRDIEFMRKAFQVTGKTSTSPDGTKKAQFQLSSTATVKIQFVERPGNSNGTHSVAWWEKYLMAVHTQYMKSYKCGWDVWGDNHFAFDQQQTTLGEFIRRWKAMDLPYILLSSPMGGAAHNGYFVMPNGYQIQQDARPGMGVPSDVPQFSPQLCATFNDKC